MPIPSLMQIRSRLETILSIAGTQTDGQAEISKSAPPKATRWVERCVSANALFLCSYASGARASQCALSNASCTFLGMRPRSETV